MSSINRRFFSNILALSILVLSQHSEGRDPTVFNKHGKLQNPDPPPAPGESSASTQVPLTKRDEEAFAAFICDPQTLNTAAKAIFRGLAYFSEPEYQIDEKGQPIPITIQNDSFFYGENLKRPLKTWLHRQFSNPQRNNKSYGLYTRSDFDLVGAQGVDSSGKKVSVPAFRIRWFDYRKGSEVNSLVSYELKGDKIEVFYELAPEGTGPLGLLPAKSKAPVIKKACTPSLKDTLGDYFRKESPERVKRVSRSQGIDSVLLAIDPDFRDYLRNN